MTDDYTDDFEVSKHNDDYHDDFENDHTSAVLQAPHTTVTSHNQFDEYDADFEEPVSTNHEPHPATHANNNAYDPVSVPSVQSVNDEYYQDDFHNVNYNDKKQYYNNNNNNTNTTPSNTTTSSTVPITSPPPSTKSVSSPSPSIVPKPAAPAPTSLHVNTSSPTAATKATTSTAAASHTSKPPIQAPPPASSSTSPSKTPSSTIQQRSSSPAPKTSSKSPSSATKKTPAKQSATTTSTTLNKKSKKEEEEKYFDITSPISPPLSSRSLQPTSSSPAPAASAASAAESHKFVSQPLSTPHTFTRITSLSHLPIIVRVGERDIMWTINDKSKEPVVQSVNYNDILSIDNYVSSQVVADNQTKEKCFNISCLGYSLCLQASSVDEKDDYIHQLNSWWSNCKTGVFSPNKLNKQDKNVIKSHSSAKKQHHKSPSPSKSPSSPSARKSRPSSSPLTSPRSPHNNNNSSSSSSSNAQSSTSHHQASSNKSASQKKKQRPSTGQPPDEASRQADIAQKRKASDYARATRELMKRKREMELQKQQQAQQRSDSNSPTTSPRSARKHTASSDANATTTTASSHSTNDNTDEYHDDFEVEVHVADDAPQQSSPKASRSKKKSNKSKASKSADPTSPRPASSPLMRVSGASTARPASSASTNSQPHVIQHPKQRILPNHTYVRPDPELLEKQDHYWSDMMSQFAERRQRTKLEYIARSRQQLHRPQSSALTSRSARITNALSRHHAVLGLSRPRTAYSHGHVSEQSVGPPSKLQAEMDAQLTVFKAQEVMRQYSNGNDKNNDEDNEEEINIDDDEKDVDADGIPRPHSHSSHRAASRSRSRSRPRAPALSTILAGDASALPPGNLKKVMTDRPGRWDVSAQLRFGHDVLRGLCSDASYANYRPDDPELQAHAGTTKNLAYYYDLLKKLKISLEKTKVSAIHKVMFESSIDPSAPSSSYSTRPSTAAHSHVYAQTARPASHDWDGSVTPTSVNVLPPYDSLVDPYVAMSPSKQRVIEQQREWDLQHRPELRQIMKGRAEAARKERDEKSSDREDDIQRIYSRPNPMTLRSRPSSNYSSTSRPSSSHSNNVHYLQPRPPSGNRLAKTLNAKNRSIAWRGDGRNTYDRSPSPSSSSSTTAPSSSTALMSMNDDSNRDRNNEMPTIPETNSPEAKLKHDNNTPTNAQSQSQSSRPYSRPSSSYLSRSRPASSRSRPPSSNSRPTSSHSRPSSRYSTRSRSSFALTRPKGPLPTPLTPLELGMDWFVITSKWEGEPSQLTKDMLAMDKGSVDDMPPSKRTTEFLLCFRILSNIYLQLGMSVAASPPTFSATSPPSVEQLSSLQNAIRELLPFRDTIIEAIEAISQREQTILAINSCTDPSQCLQHVLSLQEKDERVLLILDRYQQDFMSVFPDYFPTGRFVFKGEDYVEKVWLEGDRIKEFMRDLIRDNDAATNSYHNAHNDAQHTYSSGFAHTANVYENAASKQRPSTARKHQHKHLHHHSHSHSKSRDYGDDSNSDALSTSSSHPDARPASRGALSPLPPPFMPTYANLGLSLAISGDQNIAAQAAQLVLKDLKKQKRGFSARR